MLISFFEFGLNMWSLLCYKYVIQSEQIVEALHQREREYIKINT